MGQETGKRGAGAVDLQPTIPKSDRLLGLAISYGTVERPGGSLVASNAADGGTVFNFSLHLVRP